MTGKKIVFSGCHITGKDLLTDLISANIHISYIVSIGPETAKREKVSGYFDFSGLAKEYNIPLYTVKSYSLKSEEDIVFFKNNQFDLLIQGGWQRLFPDQVLCSLSIGAVGVHGSSEFLPRGRGRSPINWSIIEGRDRFIMHYFLMKPGVDDGEVFYYKSFDINIWDDCKTLYLKNTMLTSEVLIEYIPKLLNREIEFHAQVGEPSYYPKRTEEDGKINWNASMLSIYNLVRAVTKPYPGAFTYSQDKKVTIWRCQPFDTRLDNPRQRIGQVVNMFSSGEVVIKCGDGLLLITDYEGEITKNSILE